MTNENQQKPNLSTQSYLNNTWIEVLTTPPQFTDGLEQMTMVYDSFNDKVILFGGAYVSSGWQYSDQTWIYDYVANEWTRSYASNPPPGRQKHVMSYDSKNRMTIIFGGNGLSGDLLDTWGYNYTSNAWIQLDNSNTSLDTGLNDAVMIYDPVNELSVFISYYKQISSYNYTSDEWISFYPAFPGNEHSFLPQSGLSYDRLNKQIILFGGGNNNEYFNTWALNVTSRTWALRSPVSYPAGRTMHQMIFDSKNNLTLMYGGYDGGLIEEMWNYNYTANKWSQIFLQNTAWERYEFGMTYIAPYNVTLLFGGYATNPSSGTSSRVTDTWVFKLNTTEPLIITRTKTETDTESFTETSTYTETSTTTETTTDIITSTTEVTSIISTTEELTKTEMSVYTSSTTITEFKTDTLTKTEYDTEYDTMTSIETVSAFDSPTPGYQVLIVMIGLLSTWYLRSIKRGR